jgi:hypothetical protein
MYLGKVNQWWQYNNLKLFLMFFVMWVIILMFIVIYLNILYLEYNIEDVIEVVIPSSGIYESFLYFYSESVMFLINYINRNVNGV